MLKKALIVGCGLTALVSGYTQAEGYYGANIAFVDYSEEGIDDEASLTAVVGRLGATFSENFSGEIRIGVGVGDDTVDVLGYDVDVELDNMYGAYFRAGIPVTNSFFPYAVVGYTRGEVSASASGFDDISESETDTSFGLGADINISQNFIVNVEYMSYFDKDGAEIEGFSVGIAAKF